MKTTEEHDLRWRVNHHKALETLAAPGCKKTGLQLWRALRRIESKTNRAATDWCNGDISDTEFEEQVGSATKSVKALFGVIPEGFFVNSDCRGCSLKLREGNVPEGMQTDWGRYGILAAEI